MPRRAPRLVLVGGAGRMGRILAPLFRRRGYALAVEDPAGAPRGTREAAPGEAREADVVVVAVPLPLTPRVLGELLAAKPRGLVVELASVKKDVLPLFPRAARAGVRLASVHPMFGPSTRGAKGRDLILCDTGDAAALRAARRLFSGSGLVVRTLPVAQHDPWVARTMALAHLTGLLAAGVLARSGTPLAAPAGLSSSSFRRLLALALPLLADEPELLYGIQRAAPRGLEPQALLARELAEWRAALAEGPESFARRLLELRRAAS